MNEYYYIDEDTSSITSYDEPITYTSVYAYNANSDSFYTVSEPSPSINTYYAFNSEYSTYVPLQPPKEVFYELISESEESEESEVTESTE